ncbi:hypothetical protein [Deinococcus sp. NW-56]|uniref:hypothetical protein n=1 Tax=Deinococcus sp. NW-56 TaxID=2080419 RepID=UPI000CF3A0FF|nr:hypothetical protein [Deinococcus sp. NW-56]
MTTALVLIVISLAGAGLLLLTRRDGGFPAARSQGAEDALLRQLLSMTLGNRAAIERAVAARQRQFPRATRAELLRMVLDEYRRDHARN